MHTQPVWLTHEKNEGSASAQWTVSECLVHLIVYLCIQITLKIKKHEI